MIIIKTAPQIIADNIIQLMKDRVINNKDRLSVERFGKMYNVSQTVVREALHILESRDLAKRIPRHGWYVRIPTIDEIDKLFETREVIEIFVNKKMALSYNEDFKSRHLTIHNRMRQMLEARNWGEFFKYGSEIHRSIYELSGYTILAKLYDTIQDLLDVYYVNTNTINNKDQYNAHLLEIEDHEMLIESIINKDLERIEELTINHLHHVRKRMELVATANLDNY